MKLSTDNIVLLVAAAAVAGGLFYLGRSIAETSDELGRVTGSPLLRAVGLSS